MNIRNALHRCSDCGVQITVSALLQAISDKDEWQCRTCWRERHGHVCAGCGGALPGPLRIRRPRELRRFYCGACWPVVLRGRSDSDRTVAPYCYHWTTCDHCGIGMNVERSDNRFCSPNCQQKEARRAARDELVCDVCGGDIDSVRSDARYCSSACRQRAYRLRKAAG